MITDKDATSAQVLASIDRKQQTFLIDSGTSKCIISKDYLDKTNLIIDAPSNSVLIVGNNAWLHPLGGAYNVPVYIRQVTIPINMIVMDNPSYPAILGSTWLWKAQAEIQYSDNVLKFHWKGLKY